MVLDENEREVLLNITHTIAEGVLLFGEEHRELSELVGCCKELGFHGILVGLFEDFSAIAMKELYPLGS